jgi:hypothetical protein
MSLRIYVVERLIDGPSIEAEEAIRAVYPQIEIVHGTKSVGEGKWKSAVAWKREWPKYVHTLDIVVASRRTLALGGTVEVEDAMALDLPIFTAHSGKLYPVSHLWYEEIACLAACIGRGHRSRMHADPNKVSQTRHGRSSLIDNGRRPEQTYRSKELR